MRYYSAMLQKYVLLFDLTMSRVKRGDWLLSHLGCIGANKVQCFLDDRLIYKRNSIVWWGITIWFLFAFMYSSGKSWAALLMKQIWYGTTRPSIMLPRKGNNTVSSSTGLSPSISSQVKNNSFTHACAVEFAQHDFRIRSTVSAVAASAPVWISASIPSRRTVSTMLP